jgi:transcriptional regulator of NAD metabolism
MTETEPAADPIQRRRSILARLAASPVPIPGELLARDFGVSRQAIVHDIAVLRAAGEPIVSTVRGYLIVRSAHEARVRSVVAVRHAPAEAERELTAIVDRGVRVVDVVVEHPVYGELRAQLQIESRADVAAWAEATRRAGAHLLSELTDGVHLHTLEAETGDRLEAARAALQDLGYLLPA